MIALVPENILSLVRDIFREQRFFRLKQNLIALNITQQEIS